MKVVFELHSVPLMNTPVDLALYARNGQLTVIVEIKYILGTSRTWATKTRRNILAHGQSCNVAIFLIITPDRLFLWKNTGTNPAQIPPTYEVDMQSEFAPYFESTGLDPNHIRRHAFELLVGTWLSDVTRSENATGEFNDERSWLDESGFRAAVKGGRIKFDIAA